MGAWTAFLYRLPVDTAGQAGNPVKMPPWQRSQSQQVLLSQCSRASMAFEHCVNTQSVPGFTDFGSLERLAQEGLVSSRAGSVESGSSAETEETQRSSCTPSLDSSSSLSQNIGPQPREDASNRGTEAFDDTSQVCNSSHEELWEIIRKHDEARRLSLEEEEGNLDLPSVECPERERSNSLSLFEFLQAIEEEPLPPKQRCEKSNKGRPFNMFRPRKNKDKKKAKGMLCEAKDAKDNESGNTGTERQLRINGEVEAREGPRISGEGNVSTQRDVISCNQKKEVHCGATIATDTSCGMDNNSSQKSLANHERTHSSMLPLDAVAGFPKKRQDVFPVPLNSMTFTLDSSRLSMHEASATTAMCSHCQANTVQVHPEVQAQLNTDGTPVQASASPSLRDIEVDASMLKSESWRQAVDPCFAQKQNPEVAMRQDVIYELMQTEFHIVRTLRIMTDIFHRGLKEELEMEEVTLERLVPCLNELLRIHSRFLECLLMRRRQALFEGGGDRNFLIVWIADILVNQFSGGNAESLVRTYGAFCSRHNDALAFYKDLLSRNRSFQMFIQKQSKNPQALRLGIPECFLLVTQRITKYPVLISRILQHTEVGTNEHNQLVRALTLVKTVVTAVDGRVNRAQRLKEIAGRIDARAYTQTKGGQQFRREDLREDAPSCSTGCSRVLVREGAVTLKGAADRRKDVLLILLSDLLVFLQERDQKYTFASLDQKPAVIPLQKLIVREVANSDRGLFLISASPEGPEMYEVHVVSRDQRNAWKGLIRHAVASLQDTEGFTNHKMKRNVDGFQVGRCQALQEPLGQRDGQLSSSFEENLQAWAKMAESNDIGRTFSTELPSSQACRLQDSLLNLAVQQADGLRKLLLLAMGVPSESVLSEGAPFDEWGLTRSKSSASCPETSDGTPVVLPRRAETFGGFDSNTSAKGDLRGVRTSSDPLLLISKPEPLSPSQQTIDMMQSLMQTLFTLKAAVDRCGSECWHSCPTCSDVASVDRTSKTTDGSPRWEERRVVHLEKRESRLWQAEKAWQEKRACQQKELDQLEAQLMEEASCLGIVRRKSDGAGNGPSRRHAAQGHESRCRSEIMRDLKGFDKTSCTAAVCKTQSLDRRGSFDSITRNEKLRAKATTQESAPSRFSNRLLIRGSTKSRCRPKSTSPKNIKPAPMQSQGRAVSEGSESQDGDRRLHPNTATLLHVQRQFQQDSIAVNQKEITTVTPPRPLNTENVATGEIFYC
uniref:Uncharacterized protein n=1 Tax=Eptatretus burgeri TaxID=7764 RepID=A0A8C4R918_EPTBU